MYELEQDLLSVWRYKIKDVNYQVRKIAEVDTSH